MTRGLRSIIILAVLVSAAARASGPERAPPVSHPATAKECGECHMAFQPALLPAESWARIMDGLQDHFGDDASLAADIAADIRGHLTTHAGDVGDPGVTRITEQPWFVEEHVHSPSVWQRPTIRSNSNCPACHPRAEWGIYGDD